VTALVTKQELVGLPWLWLRLAVSVAVSDFSWPYWSVCTRLFLYAKFFVLNSVVLSPKYPVVLSFLKMARMRQPEIKDASSAVINAEMC
jgi:hypothetical protein